MKYVARPAPIMELFLSAIQVNTLLSLIFLASPVLLLNAQVVRDATITGTLMDPQGRAVVKGKLVLSPAVGLRNIETVSDDKGQFTFQHLAEGEYRLTAEAQGFASKSTSLVLALAEARNADIQFGLIESQAQSVTVTADVKDYSVFNPDPAQRIMIRQETLDANPGRPGMPISIPGMPAQSPAGGIKPPQYFVPGVAGDHGEPIAQYFQVGKYLFPNNLPANAHGNGYADPNTLIPIAIESVQTDGGAFNVREGNNSVNAAAIFGLRDRLEPMIRLTADYRDVDLVAGWSPANPATKGWIGFELSYGNGFLDRLEHRKQYKINASRVFTMGKHDLTVYGIGYYGFSFLPGLAPIDVPVPGDTIDTRQKEKAASAIFIANDVWHLSPSREIQFSGYFRTYSLDVRPNFGDGLLRQTEVRTATAQTVSYFERFTKSMAFLSGFEFRREAPRGLNLYKEDDNGVLQPTTSNDLTINFYSPYASLDGTVGKHLHYNLGLRHDEVDFNNRDRLNPASSFGERQGVNSPKGTISLFGESPWLPTVAFSYGQAFHVNDPRIGITGTRGGTVISKARSYQIVTSKTIAKTDFKVILAHVTTSQQLARINNDTGLQEDLGPGLLKSLTISARRYFSHGFLQGSFAKADARDRIAGEPTPEAPRLIWDLLGAINRLPFGLQARGEYAYVGRKPLGNGFASVPVREFRGALIRSFDGKRMDVGMNFLIVRGYAGQTLETLALPGEGQPFERVTGFRLKSYVTASWTYRFGRTRS